VFERFTEQARQVIVFGQEEARRLKHDFIGTEHLLLGLCREQESIAARVLQASGITADRARTEVVRHVSAGESVGGRQVPFTPRAKKVMELALREAHSLGHSYIAPEHLLLGLLRENDGVAIRIVLDLGADPAAIRAQLIEMLGRADQALAAAARDVPQPQQPHPQHVEPRPVLDWERANLLWRPEGLELRIPLHLGEGALATFAADEVWSSEPLARVRREIWNGWLALASPALLDEIDAGTLRRTLDSAAKRAADVRGREHGRVEDFLRRLREQPPAEN
jgi:ATP-dependent Clp protease ATP-binding subunit ClpA